MKAFRYKLGHEAFKTLTVGELRMQLAAYPDDMPVLAEWEGQRTPVNHDIRVESYSAGFELDRADCLVIAVD